MMRSNYINWELYSDNNVLEKLGKALQQMRLNKNITQAALAKRAGLDRSTISQLESGRAATLLTFIQVLRAMGRLDVLNNFIESDTPSPIAVMEQEERYKKKKRKRASSTQRNILPPKPRSTW